MGRPYGLLRAGYPFLKTLGMRRITNFPLDVAVGDEGRLYILCRNDGAAVIRVWSFDDAERLTDDLIGIGGYGKDEGQFTWPVNVICDSEENVYVSDEALHRISSFTKDGEFIGCWGEEGDGEGQINGPAGIEFDADENMYVVDTLNHRIQKFTKDGEYISGWGSLGDAPGEFNMPYGVTVDEVGDVYIGDWRNDRVQKFNADGEFIFEIGSSGSGKGEFNRPTGVAVDKFGDIYVADTGNDRIQLFNEKGEYVQRFIGDATLSRVARDYMLTNAYPNRLRDMADLEIQKRLRAPKSVRVSDGLMFVADYRSYRVQVYKNESIPLTESQMSAPMRAPTLATV